MSTSPSQAKKAESSVFHKDVPKLSTSGGTGPVLCSQQGTMFSSAPPKLGGTRLLPHGAVRDSQPSHYLFRLLGRKTQVSSLDPDQCVLNTNRTALDTILLDSCFQSSLILFTQHFAFNDEENQMNYGVFFLIVLLFFNLPGLINTP